MANIVVITGGGTGGHLKIADVFIDEFKAKGFEVIYIGSTSGQDKSWFENDNRLKEAIFLETSGVVNKSGFSKVFSLLNIFKKALFCLKILIQNRVNIVVSVGGFSAASASFAAILKRDCKFFIHEQNSKMGSLNLKTMKYATKVYSSFHDFSSIKDYPVKDEFFQKARVRTKLKTIGFFGGSQGAKAINDFALKVAPFLQERGIKIVHQAGRSDLNRVIEEYEKLGIKADIFDFTKDFVEKMNECDFSVSRAGASTLFEICASNLPTFFIPYKYAASNHQYFNAKALSEKNLCFLQNEDELSIDYFLECLDCDLEDISTRLKTSINPNGAKKIVEDILNS